VHIHHRFDSNSLELYFFRLKGFFLFNLFKIKSFQLNFFVIQTRSVYKWYSFFNLEPFLRTNQNGIAMQSKFILLQKIQKLVESKLVFGGQIGHLKTYFTFQLKQKWIKS
jgi:hypothetical protein